MFRFMKLAPMVWMAWRWYRGRKAGTDLSSTVRRR